MTFQELGLNEPILRALADQGYEQPSPIQDLRLRRPHSPAAQRP